MPILDEQIATIEKLHERRQAARALRQQAIDALCQHPYEPRARGGSAAAPWKVAGWLAPGDEVEKALMLRALRGKASKDRLETQRVKSHDAILADLSRIRLKDCYTRSAPVGTAASYENIPVLRSALVLHVLVTTPGYALGEAALACFYRLVQELHEIAHPAWSAGAARAGDEAPESAFVAGECGRALLALENALLRTADAVDLLAKAARRDASPRQNVKAWASKDIKIREASLAVSLDVLRPDLIADVGTQGTPAQLLEDLTSKLSCIATTDHRWIYEETPLKLDPKDSRSSLLNLASHAIAQAETEDLLNALPRTVTSGGGGPLAASDFGKQAAKNLRFAAQRVRLLLAPLERFASTVIDAELAAASQHLDRQVDESELLFAAALLNRIKAGSDALRTHPKARAAVEMLNQRLTADGRLLTLRAFDVLEKGYRLPVTPLEVTRRFAELIAFVDFEPSAQLVERLMRPLHDTRAPGVEGEIGGWAPDPAPSGRESHWWATALAVDSLDWVGLMLDEAINRQVLRHFSVRWPAALSLKLEDLFYPDFGICEHGHMAGDKDSVAIKLQHLRAHAGTGPPYKDLFSLVLYGPPGTGKTTLVEALAKSANVPLVEVTPSDILMGGGEEIEHRARLVFTALSMLTHAVILFDEFDSILQARDTAQTTGATRTIFEFLTPGMLPKLKRLHDAAESQRVSYVLATNFIYNLDQAAIRKGRFDGQHGIYPPDVLSRVGRLLDQYQRWQADGNGQAQGRDTDLPHGLLLNLVKATRGASMVQVGKPGWFTAPVDQKTKVGTPFHCLVTPKVLGRDALAVGDLDEVSIEAIPPPDGREQSTPSEAAKRRRDFNVYWKDWATIEGWESSLTSAAVPKTAAEWNELVERCMGGA